MKKRYLVIAVIVLAIFNSFIYNFMFIYKDSVQCSYELKEEVLLVTEFGVIKNSEGKAKSLGVISFKLGDILYGFGHGSGLNEDDEYTIYKTTPSINKRTKDYSGEMLYEYYRFNERKLGKMISDNEDGIIIFCDDVNNYNYQSIDIANEIVSGEAEILIRDEFGKVQTYSVTIEILVNRGKEQLDIIVTDERLKEKTGGILLGMSGSPIVQNNKLVGVLTHAYKKNEYRARGIIIWNIDCIKEYMIKD